MSGECPDTDGPIPAETWEQRYADGLTGWDLGFGVRVIPNALYYGGLIAAIARFAPTLQAEGTG